ncbi:MAG: phosphoribosylamine--glycine ligase [Chitinophagales bacterium]
MRILLIGSGGREHALAWKLAQSPKCEKLFIAPGNPGTAQHGENISLDTTNFEKVADFAVQEKINMIVVGPEDPLVNGISDYFYDHSDLNHIAVIGPVKAGALLEGSKAYAKAFMKENNIPTAGYTEITADNLEEGMDIIDKKTTPIVLKADGLAAGKGVLILLDEKAAKRSLREMIMDEKFGEASQKVVIEDFLDGIEFSVFALCDGENYKLLPTAKDYKRIGEGDKGLNTGGMGAVSPVPFVDEALMQKVEERIVKPTIEGLKKRNIEYKGFIYFGLIKVGNDPYVIEYNVRLGDPEAQVVIPSIKSDLVDLFEATANGKLNEIGIEKDSRSCATVVLVSGGYPEAYEKGKEISLPRETNDSIIFHAGTKTDDGLLKTSGGRVLAITSFDDTLKKALEKSKRLCDTIDFDKKYYRKDIGFDVLT